MAADDGAGRIHRTTFTAVSALLFALALAFTIARIAIRLRVQKQFLIDDVFLLFACACLVVAMGLLYSLLDSMFIVDAAVKGKTSTVLLSSFINLSLRFHKWGSIAFALIWTSIFSVKFSFLFFFRLLVQRVRMMVIFWWVVTIATLAAWVFAFVAIFLPCPYFDLRGLLCGYTSSTKKIIAYGSVSVALDIITDILIMAIPVCLLWRIQIKTSRKLALASSLCLSIIMIMIAVTRIAGIRSSMGTVDIVWEVFWHVAEGCVAIVMVTLIAFRSLFVAHVGGDKQSPKKPSITSRQKKRLQAVFDGKAGRNVSGDTVHGEKELPAIPRATVTGIRTLIRGGRSPTQTGGSTLVGDSVTDDYGEPWSHSDRSSSRGIRVERNIYSEVESGPTRSPNLTHHQPMRNSSVV